MQTFGGGGVRRRSVWCCLEGEREGGGQEVCKRRWLSVVQENVCRCCLPLVKASQRLLETAVQGGTGCIDCVCSLCDRHAGVCYLTFLLFVFLALNSTMKNGHNT